jgi:hypothetical protein
VQLFLGALLSFALLGGFQSEFLKLLCMDVHVVSQLAIASHHKRKTLIFFLKQASPDHTKDSFQVEVVFFLFLFVQHAAFICIFIYFFLVIVRLPFELCMHVLFSVFLVQFRKLIFVVCKFVCIVFPVECEMGKGRSTFSHPGPHFCLKCWVICVL